MAKAHVDPSELRRFTSELARFNNELEGLLGGLHGKLRGLEASWTDQEQKKFSENFEGTLKVFGKFLEDSRQHVSTINKKAAIIEEYLKTR